MSIEGAATSTGISPSTLRRLELGQRKAPSFIVPKLVEQLQMTSPESRYLMESGLHVRTEPPTSPSLLENLARLQSRYQRGDSAKLDLDFLNLIDQAIGLGPGSAKATETVFQIKAAYVDYLLWWYRRREAMEWADSLPFRFADRPILEGWSSVVRAHWQFRWERANDENDVCGFLTRRLPLHRGSPSCPVVGTDLAWRLGLTERPAQGLQLLDVIQSEPSWANASRQTIFHSQVTRSGLNFLDGKKAKALDSFPEENKENFQLRVSATTIRGRMLVEMGDKSAAINLLKNLREESVANGLDHFVGVLDRRIQNGGTYLNRW